MSGRGETAGVKPDLVHKILETLRIAHDEVTKLTVDKPTGGMLGGSGPAADLLSDMNHATKGLDLWLSSQANALIAFGHALEDAMKAIQNSDDDSAADARTIQGAVDGVTKQFYELTGKDTRATNALANVPGPFGALGQAVQTLQSEAQFDAGVNK